LPTAPWTLAETERSQHAYIVKSVWEHASLGIDDNSVLEAGQVAQALAQRRSSGGAWFAERYIEGREFNVGLLQNASGIEILPITEICFTDYPQGKPRIVGYAAKWDSGTFEYQNTRRVFLDAEAEPQLAAQLRGLAQACWDLFELRGYARIDFRVDVQGQAWILEINANPCLSPDAGYAAMLQHAGITYPHAIDCILQCAGTG
jgi:D-alanine-D-alanine ligase